MHVVLDRLPEDIPGGLPHDPGSGHRRRLPDRKPRADADTAAQSRPTTLDDLVVEVAIIRPGPIQGNAVHPYLRRRQGKEEVTYLHPSLQPALEETMGVILYQEQVMKIAIDVAGFSAAESDGFRRAMGTWRSSKEMEKLHKRFVDGCIERNGLTTDQAEELFRQVAAFASFGFNKSHAAAFARTAYESAFLKLFYPAQFVTGLINAQPMGFYPVEVLINDAKRHGVRGPAGRHQQEPLPDDDRVGRHARRATAARRRHRPQTGDRRLVGLRRARPRGTRSLGRANCRGHTAFASGSGSSRGSASRKGRRSTQSWRAVARSRRSRIWSRARSSPRRSSSG